MIPPQTLDPPVAWTRLDLEGKRRRLLDVATVVFTREGLEAPMETVADAAGVGVGSIYRCYASKRDLIAAIVVEQMEGLRAEVDAAHDEAGAGAALERSIHRIVERQATNGLVRAALAATSD